MSPVEFMEENEGIFKTSVNFNDPIHNYILKNTLDENMNEQKYSECMRIDDDSMMDSESEEDCELTFSSYIDIFTQGSSAINDEHIALEAVVIQNDHDKERQKCNQLDLLNDRKLSNGNKHDSTCEVSNSVFYDSSGFTVLGKDSMDSTVLVEDLIGSTVLGEYSKGSNYGENSGLTLLVEDSKDSNNGENSRGSTVLREDSKGSNQGENSRGSTVLGKDSRGSALIGESIDEHFKENVANQKSCEDNSSMEIDVNSNQEMLRNVEQKTLEINNETHSKMITEWESTDILTNKEKIDSSNENIVQSKFYKRENLKNLHISYDDVNDLESDSGFSSITLDKSLQDTNMNVDSNIESDSNTESDSDFSIDDLNESLQDDNIDEGSLVNFDCNICCQKYKYADEFKNHMSSHGVNMFSCNQCGFATADIILHQQHMAKHGTDINLLENQSDITEYKTESTEYKCKICHFRGDRREDLNSHMKSHIKAYSCDNCDFSGYKRLELKIHIMSHVCMKKKGIKKSSVLKQEFFDKSYKCDHCTFTCVYEKDFNQHTKGHFTGMSHNCDVCDYGTNNRKYFNDHVRQHTIKPYKCLFCQYSFHKPSELSNHVIKKHTDHKPFKCEYCEYTCKEKKMLNLHLRKHKEKNILCKYCDFSCNQNSDLVIHTFYKHREYCTANTFKCEECGKEFIKCRELKIHQSTHTKQYSNKCAECDYSCSRKENLEVHIKRYHTKQEKKVKCPKCDYTCFNHTQLKRHSVVHTDRRYFSCDLCDYVCRKKVTLQEHQLKEHNATCINAESRAKCDKCEYVAVDKIELKRHSVVHSGDNFFKCGQCQYVCRGKNTLRIHQLKEHVANVKVINSNKKCDKCEYVAIDKRDLNRHSVVHTGVKFFECEHCQYVCRNKKTLNVHELKQHIENGKPISSIVNNSITNLLKLANNKDTLNESIIEHLTDAKKDIYKKITSNSIKDEYICDMKDIPLLEKLKNTNVFACGICEFLCLDDAEMCQHLVLKHEKVNSKLYKCEICEYECLKELDFEEHIKDHTLSSLIKFKHF